MAAMRPAWISRALRRVHARIRSARRRWVPGEWLKRKRIGTALFLSPRLASCAAANSRARSRSSSPSLLIHEIRLGRNVWLKEERRKWGTVGWTFTRANEPHNLRLSLSSCARRSPVALSSHCIINRKSRLSCLALSKINNQRGKKQGKKESRGSSD